MNRRVLFAAGAGIQAVGFVLIGYGVMQLPVQARTSSAIERSDSAGMWQRDNTQAQRQCVLDAATAGALNGWVTTPELDKLYGMCLAQRKLAI
jgi:hypothetical protein